MIVGAASPRPSSLNDLIDSRLTARLDRLDFRTRKVFAGRLQGERRSKRRGRSVEFDDYRDYVPGDDLRHVDWNVFARFDRLFIKLFLEEEDLALHVALDASASMDAGGPNEPTKLLYAARLATALTYVGLAANNRVGVSVFGTPSPAREQGDAGPFKVARLPDLRGRHNFQRVVKFILDSAWPEAGRGGVVGSGGSFGEALTAIARSRVGKGVMVVISDFLIPPEPAEPVQPGYARGLRALAAAGGYDTWCIQVLSPSEIEPEREVRAGITGDLRLTDVESGQAMEVTMTASLVKQYKQRLEQYCADLRAFCLARQMTHVLTRTDAPIDALILDTLRRQGMVG